MNFSDIRKSIRKSIAEQELSQDESSVTGRCSWNSPMVDVQEVELSTEQVSSPDAAPSTDAERPWYRHPAFISLACALTLAIILAVVLAIVFISSLSSNTNVAVLPLLPSYCNPTTPSMEPYYVLLGVGGSEYAVIVDTGSSNLLIASEQCTSCHVAPKHPAVDQPAALSFSTDFGSGQRIMWPFAAC